MYYDVGTSRGLQQRLDGHIVKGMEQPAVYRYHDVRLFLRDWWEHRHQKDPAFSKSEVSRRLGLPNTRSYFTDVLAGKAITDLFVQRFQEVLGLTVEEARYFRALVTFSQASAPEEREAAFDALVVLDRSPTRTLDPRHHRYYTQWWNGAVRAVLDLEDFQDDWARLAARIQPPITARQARESVALMEELGLVARDDRGFWKPLDRMLSTGEDVRNELVLRLQLQQFDLARRAIVTRFPIPKEVATSTLTLSASGVEQVRARFHQFRTEVRSIAFHDPDPADRVYVLCSALFPLTSHE